MILNIHNIIYYIILNIVTGHCEGIKSKPSVLDTCTWVTRAGIQYFSNLHVPTLLEILFLNFVKRKNYYGRQKAV